MIRIQEIFEEYGFGRSYGVLQIRLHLLPYLDRLFLYLFIFILKLTIADINHSRHVEAYIKYLCYRINVSKLVIGCIFIFIWNLPIQIEITKQFQTIRDLQKLEKLEEPTIVPRVCVIISGLICIDKKIEQIQRSIFWYSFFIWSAIFHI